MMSTDDIKIVPQWKKTKEDIWNEAFSTLKDTPEAAKTVHPERTIWYRAAISVAAVTALLVCIAFFYTKEEVARKGAHLAVTLPDGSSVDLNAESKITYKPLWWYVSRDVQLKGEAYFEVKKGSRFNVRANDYTVSVLGTSFNVYSRPGKFNVVCLTGKVEVADPVQSLVLTAGTQTAVRDGKLQKEVIKDAEEAIGWKQGKFVFVSVPLAEVIEEIERQYNIEVITHSDLDHLYYGNFTITTNPADILEIVGSPFGVEFKIK